MQVLLEEQVMHCRSINGQSKMQELPLARYPDVHVLHSLEDEHVVHWAFIVVQEKQSPPAK